jgi:mitotic spindle assembly checkpoint protein MAD2
VFGFVILQQAVAQASRNHITLRGSTEIVTEFFGSLSMFINESHSRMFTSYYLPGYSINSVLYQRGLYPPENFTAVKKYGLQMMVTTDPGLSKYLASVLQQLSEWLMSGNVQKLVIVITNVDTNKPVERWVFDVQTDQDTLSTGKAQEKSEKDIMREIQAIIRQITSSVTFLPLLDFPCSFDLLVYTKSDVAVPSAWEESDPRYIAKSNEVKLRSFTTKVHVVHFIPPYRVFSVCVLVPFIL